MEMEEKKILEDELTEVSGGEETAEDFINRETASRRKMKELRAILEENIPANLRDGLARAEGDEEFLRMLAENGIEVQKLKRRIPDDAIDRIAGGLKDTEDTVICCPNCENSESDKISLQIFTSIVSGSCQYQCQKCGNFFRPRRDRRK